jgi:hypothetical protein
MVPVRKPGRPLSACPHPRDRPCSCGSVTAAIPKKQACHCGSSSTTPDHAASHNPDQSPTEPTSPSRGAFKVQKPSARPQSTRKQSFDVTNFDRIDMNNINVVSFESRPTNAMPIIFSNGYAVPGNPQDYGFMPHYANFQPQDFKVPMQHPQFINSEASARMDTLNTSIDHTILNNPFDVSNGSINGTNSTVASKPIVTASLDTAKATNDEAKLPTNGNSCCAPKQPTHSHSSSTASSISEPQEPAVASCCSSKPSGVVKDEQQSDDSIFTAFSSQRDDQMLPGNNMSFGPVLYSQHMPQDGVFTYPPSYGSFNNPLEPLAWQQTARSNGHGPSDVQASSKSNVANFDLTSASSAKDTVHTCHCGDGCQCVGCAAHPYNDATQKYVRSAYTSMAEDVPSGEPYANGAATVARSVDVNGTHGTDAVMSPTSNAPSSATSTNGDEQNLPAADYFFVNYSFLECGGDTESCPCGDDCQCIGCTIHNLPAVATVQ